MTELLEAIAAAARDAGTVILETPAPPPMTTFDEFRIAFGEVQAPAEALLRDRLDDLLPGVKWAEEFETELPVGERVWVVDVVDGAVQYMQGLPQWCVSVTLVDNRSAVAAVLHNPVRGETYLAAKGSGAFRNGHAVTPSLKSDLSAALVATSQPPFAYTQPLAIAEAGRSLSAVLGKVVAVRNLGPTSWQIADVAAGRLDAFWGYGVDDANNLGAALIAQEAGVVVTDASGEPWRPGSASFLAAPTSLHSQLVELLGQ
jgi:myo-inositol-1(or 4)-monophosphatase